MAEAVFHLTAGESPLLISIPHCGEALPDSLFARLTPNGQARADTDWHLEQLYDFAPELGASVLSAHYSRYLIDLNRAPDGAPLYPGQSETGLCPLTSFSNEALYRAGQEPEIAEIGERIERYWQPYHAQLVAELERIKARHGYALLWDAHSIQSRVPRFFSGRLPDLNLGTADGRSCAPQFQATVMAHLQDSGYQHVCNGRFKGGYITRHYGQPQASIHALQMEIAQLCYMSETPDFSYRPGLADLLKSLLKQVLAGLIETRQ